jgi:hypothetical protein
MKLFLPLVLIASAATPADQPQSYLLSISNIPLRSTESIEGFSIKTWGVQFGAVCRIPDGWRIKAGNSATPDGELSGEGSQGATWFNRSSPPELRSFVLVTLVAPVQRADIRSGSGVIPATFKGYAIISTDNGDVQRALAYKNITLTPALSCPHK